MYNTLLAQKLTPMNWENIKAALNILWQGLLAIFVVIAIIIVAVKLIELCIGKVQNRKRERSAGNAPEEKDR